MRVRTAGAQDGDRTILLHSALRLSEGQLQRIALARTLYVPADLYVIDDVLATLDLVLARSIFHNALRLLPRAHVHPPPALVLVTRSPYYFSYADRVVVLAGGRIVRQGSTPPPPPAATAIAARTLSHRCTHVAGATHTDACAQVRSRP